MVKKVITLFTVLAVALLYTAPAVADGGDGEEPDAEVGQGRNLDGELVIGRGSDTTYVVSKLLGNQYTFSQTGEDGVETENVEGDVILDAPPEGSSVGIDQLAAFQLDGDGVLPTALARSSRGPRLPGESDDPDPAGLRFTAFARDAITLVTFGGEEGPAAGIESLTQDQIRGIFVTCEITNFSQIGGADAPIEVYAIQEGSGTRSTFDDFVGGDSSSCITDPDNIIFENNANPILDEDAGVEPGERSRAIFPFSFARFSTSAITADVTPLAIDGIEVSPDTIADESFPFVRKVYFVTLVDPSTGADPAAARAAQRFVDWVCAGQDEHTEDPLSGTNYAELIDNTIEGSGFGLLDECEVTDTFEAAGLPATGRGAAAGAGLPSAQPAAALALIGAAAATRIRRG